MSVEAGSGTDKGFLNPPVAIPREGLRRRRRLTLSPGISEARGAAACMRRDALFRRMLLIADMVGGRRRVRAHDRAVARSLAADLGGGGGAADPGRLREAQRALRPRRGADPQDDARRGAEAVPAGDAVALVAWLSGGLFVSGQLDRHEALFLWLSLARPAGPARARLASFALRMAPTERCLFIGDELSAETIRSKLSGHGGVRPTSSPTSTSTRSRPWSRTASPEPAGRDPRPRPDARRAPRDHRPAQRRRRRDARTWCGR